MILVRRSARWDTPVTGAGDARIGNDSLGGGGGGSDALLP